MIPSTPTATWPRLLSPAFRSDRAGCETSAHALPHGDSCARATVSAGLSAVSPSWPVCTRWRPTAAGGTIETLAVKLTWTSVPCSPAVLGAGQQPCQWPIFRLDPALALDRPQGGQWTEGESRSSSRPRLDGHACTPGAANLTPLTTGCVTSGATSQTLGQRRRLAPESALAGPAPASALRTERRRLARRRLATRRSDQWRSGADRRRQSLSRSAHRVQLHKTAAGSRVTWPERRRPIVVAGATLPILGRLIGLAAADL